MLGDGDTRFHEGRVFVGEQGREHRWHLPERRTMAVFEHHHHLAGGGVAGGEVVAGA
jgi:hypothetical protein